MLGIIHQILPPNILSLIENNKTDRFSKPELSCHRVRRYVLVLPLKSFDQIDSTKSTENDYYSSSNNRPFIMLYSAASPQELHRILQPYAVFCGILWTPQPFSFLLPFPFFSCNTLCASFSLQQPLAFPFLLQHPFTFRDLL